MLTIAGPGNRFCDGLSRRGFLSIGGLSMGAMSLPSILRAESLSGVVKSKKSVIMVLLPGGPPHQDMYDLKPHAPREIRGEFDPIATNVPGIEICELLPRMAARMDKFVVLRSLVGAREDHNMHVCVTGWDSHPQQGDSPPIAGYPPGGWPSIGAVLSRVHGAKNKGLPPSISLSRKGSVDLTRAPIGQAGYLGSAHSAFEPNEIDRSNFVLNGISLDRLGDRKSLLDSFDRFRERVDTSGVIDGVDAFTRQAFEVMTSNHLMQALDLERESPAVRKRYGIPEGAPQRGGAKHFQNLLLAKRLVQAGARCVTLTVSRYPLGRMMKGDYNWDWHFDNFPEARLSLPMLDIGITALLDDLEEQGMLDDVAVVVWGEFGRTPRINKNGGRDHWPPVAGGLMMGGGMRTGQVIGSTNRLGEVPKDRPVNYREVLATLYQLMGIDVRSFTLPDLNGRPQYLVDHAPISEII